MKVAGLRKAKAASTTPAKSDEEKQAEQAARDLSKAWAETADARKTFLARVMNEKQAPKGWEQLIVGHLIAGESIRYSDTKQQAVRRLLGLDHLDVDQDIRDETYVDPIVILEGEIRARPDRVAFAALAIALASIEEGECQVPHAGGWNERKPFVTHAHLAPATISYLEQLEKWGYDASAERALIPMAEA